MTTADTSTLPLIGTRDWAAIENALDLRGYAVLPNLFTESDCHRIIDLYEVKENFRSHIHMARHGFGKGEYRYLKYPLPDLVRDTRKTIYPFLADIANRWNTHMNISRRYPSTHEDLISECHAAGQVRPTPLIFQYVPGDYNCLHQDLYGDIYFPLQVAVLLSEPGQDFLGGEFILTELKHGKQSCAEVIHLKKGDAVIFAVCHRPNQGSRRKGKINMRHGVSRVRSGRRHTLGIIFHDAR
ncbi:2OG-Fe(II) oxygenase [Marinobacter sp.]|uniref:2OG-Fe(II) oxygenase n=1 Tax=Marinobacter sp. TaxID=50741 RepID=UPI00260F4F6D|nr:2OG-Fe(II) oxygenase [Marinobacter sp.]